MQRKKTKRYLLEKKKSENDAEFVEQISKLSENLFYISETDSEIRPFVGEKARAINGEEILKQIGKSKESASVEERNFSELFAGLTEMQDWFGEEERETAERFAKLKDFLEKNLRDLKVFKIGRTELDIYVVGHNPEGKLMGIQTKAVET